MSNVVDQYGWQSSTGPESCGYITPEVLHILKRLKVVRVCDLGSGNGALANAMQGAGFQPAGVEYDKQGVEIAQKNYPSINFYHFGVQDDPAQVLAAEGQAFDAVVSTEVVEHLFSPHLLPIFARQIVREGGYLVISTPYHGYLKNLALSIFNSWDKHHTALWHGGHIKFWSRKTLTKLLEENGFRVIEFQGAGRLPWLWKSMILIARAV
ncbi:class I SAM-dependent methyltransferase [Rhodoferax sp.]|uniref:class I SAM-dependent methyltransferase n=1 Tax=Rhodoferax sp. TaxID=50421 RepID=UPI00284E6647|nr:class I SAM-dependent methyltransferase [Rhodoferax sp.]MDR3368613.1 class I SAM-dependent methyltransferase [Rhodoferax sp.]